MSSSGRTVHAVNATRDYSASRRYLTATMVAAALVLAACGASDSDSTRETGSPTSIWTAPIMINPANDLGHGFLDGLSCAPNLCLVLDADNDRAFVLRGGQWSDAGSPGVGGGSVECIDSTFCYAFGPNGSAVFDGSSWVKQDETTSPVEGISCVSRSFCAGVVWPESVSLFDGTSWSTPLVLPEAKQIQAVDCTSESFCVAVDQGTVGAFVFDGTQWSPAPAGVRGLRQISCSTERFCIATSSSNGDVDEIPDILIYRDGVWSTFLDAKGDAVGLSCYADEQCVITWGNVVQMLDGSTSTEEKGIVEDGWANYVDCTADGLCVVVGNDGSASMAHLAVAPAADQVPGIPLLSGPLANSPLLWADSGALLEQTYVFDEHDGPYTYINFENFSGVERSVRIGVLDGRHTRLESATFRIRGEECSFLGVPSVAPAGMSGHLAPIGSSLCLPPGTYELQTIDSNSDPAEPGNWHYATLIIR